MYQSFFGLTQYPFEISPDPSFKVPSSGGDSALASIYFAIVRRQGFVILTGEVGTGKTLLMRCLCESWRHRGFAVANIIGPRLSVVDFLNLLAFEFGLQVAEPTKANLLRALYGFFLAQFQAGLTTIIVIDEAHHLQSTVLEEIRLLTNFESTRQKLLQVVLVGQPELEKRLDSFELRALKQRIVVRCRLEPFSEQDTYRYIESRLTRAGGKTESIFPRQTIALIFQYSLGNPRLINSICERALVIACTANSRVVSPDIIREVATYFRLQPASAPASNDNSFPYPEPPMAAVLETSSSSQPLASKPDKQFCSDRNLSTPHAGLDSSFDDPKNTEDLPVQTVALEWKDPIGVAGTPLQPGVTNALGNIGNGGQSVHVSSEAASSSYDASQSALLPHRESTPPDAPYVAQLSQEAQQSLHKHEYSTPETVGDADQDAVLKSPDIGFAPEGSSILAVQADSQRWRLAAAIIALVTVFVGGGIWSFRSITGHAAEKKPHELQADSAPANPENAVFPAPQLAPDTVTQEAVLESTVLPKSDNRGADFPKSETREALNGERSAQEDRKSQAIHPVPSAFGALNAHPVVQGRATEGASAMVPSVEATPATEQEAPTAIVSSAGPALAAPPAPEDAPSAVETTTLSLANIKEPKILSKVMPQYPLVARQVRTEGDVAVELTVDETGHTRDLRVVSGPATLRQAALDALRDWRYEPSIVGGRPVSVKLVVTIRFRLN